MALTLFALQFTHNAPYRRFCQARGVSPETITDWANIPAIPTSAFKELELTSLPPAECTTIFHSSGTTEQRPSRHFHDAESLAVYEASLLSWFAVHLLTERSVGRVKVGGERPPSPRPSPPGEGAGSSAHEQFKNKFRILSLTPSPTEAPDSSLVHMFETVRREFGTRDSIFTGQVAGDGAWSVNSEKTMAALRESPKQPLVFLGTAFGFVHLLDHLGEKQIPLPRGSRVLETGGYKGRSRELLKAELHALITERLGIPPTHIVCEYGMSELSSQAYDRIAGGDANSKPSTLNPQPCFRFPPWARAQIISPETGHEVGEGETGLIRVFDLANVWSVMAVQTEDLGVRRGDGFELIGRAKAAEPRGCSLMAS
ncbi:MAG: hypothetical protein HY298_20460 [Verrucomicrobia bacterium]|nr:hypothetical protein [Verrucomicrobiota bacterium]